MRTTLTPFAADDQRAAETCPLSRKWCLQLLLQLQLGGHRIFSAGKALMMMILRSGWALGGGSRMMITARLMLFSTEINTECAQPGPVGDPGLLIGFKRVFRVTLGIKASWFSGLWVRSSSYARERQNLKVSDDENGQVAGVDLL